MSGQLIDFEFYLFWTDIAKHLSRLRAVLSENVQQLGLIADVVLARCDIFVNQSVIAA